MGWVEIEWSEVGATRIRDHDSGKGTAFMVCRRPEELYPGGDRAFVVARKRGNARGAKGGRKVETLNKRTKETAPSMSYGLNTVKSRRSTRTFNSCPVSVGRLGNGSLALIELERSREASADLLWSSTTNWKAECRRSACSVWEEGRR
jgi:hypothetical protein